MSDRHLKYWPAHAAHRLSAPATTLFYNAEVSARRYPNKPFLVFYDTEVTFSAFLDEAQRIAGFLERECGVQRGDRVLLYMQNSPQFAIGYYGILRANAVVVPINPMSLTEDLLRYAQDAGARTAIVSQELYGRVEPLAGPGRALEHVLIAAYSDYIKGPTGLTVPDYIAAPRLDIGGPGVALWSHALERALEPGPLVAAPDDLCVMPYTSGTTGMPKGCMHTHRTYHVHAGCRHALGLESSRRRILLAVAPFFHVTGMQGSMNGPLYVGDTVILLPRWDRDAAAECVAAIPRLGVERDSDDGAGFPVEPQARSVRLVLAAASERRRRRNACRRRAAAREHGRAATSRATDCRKPSPPRTSIRPSDPKSNVSASRSTTSIRAWSIPRRCASCRWVKSARSSRTARRYSSGTGTARSDGRGVRRDRRQTVLAHRRLGQDRRGRLLLHGRPAQANDQRRGIQGVAGRGRVLDVPHPAVQEACVIAARDSRRGETVKASSCSRQNGAGASTPSSSSIGAGSTWRPTRSRESSSSPTSCRSPAAGKILWRELQARENARAEVRS